MEFVAVVEDVVVVAVDVVAVVVAVVVVDVLVPPQFVENVFEVVVLALVRLDV